MDTKVLQYKSIGSKDFLKLTFASFRNDERRKALETGEEVTWTVYENVVVLSLFRYLNIIAAFRIHGSMSSLELHISLWRYGVGVTLEA